MKIILRFRNLRILLTISIIPKRTNIVKQIHEKSDIFAKNKQRYFKHMSHSLLFFGILTKVYRLVTGARSVYLLATNGTRKFLHVGKGLISLRNQFDFIAPVRLPVQNYRC